MKTPLQH